MLNIFDAYHTMEHADTDLGVLMCDQCLESGGYPEKSLVEVARERVEETTSFNCVGCNAVMCQHTYRMCFGCAKSFCFPCSQKHKKNVKTHEIIFV